MSRSTKIKGKVIAQDSVEFSSLTAGTVPVLDVNKQIVSSAVTPTELSNLSGTTSPIQDQLDDEGARVSTLEDNGKILKVYAYENNAQVYADGQPGIKDPSALIRDGWYFKNSVADQKINWYYFDGLNQGTVTLGQLESAYAVMTFDAVSGAAAPILAIYTVPTGTGDVIPGFAHSRIVYDGVMTPTPVVGKKYLVYGGVEPSVHPELPRIQLAKVPAQSIGEQLPGEQILTVSFGSNSAASINSVQYMVETLGLFSDPVKHELDLRIRVASQLELDTHETNLNNPHEVTKTQVGLGNVDNTSDLNKPISTAVQNALDLKIDESREGQPNGVATLDATGKIPSTQLPSYVDDVLEFANLSAFPNPGSTGIIYLALDTNLIYRWSGSVYVEISPSQVLAWGGISGTLSSQTDLQTALDGKQGSLGFTPENVANKSTDILLGTSDTLYPSQKAVKTYVDNFVASSSPVASVNGQTGAVILDSDDLANQQAVPDYWDIADGSTIKAHLDELAARREAQNTLTKEPTGFATRDTSTTSFTDSTPDRTFTIAPVGVSFDFYVKGVKFTKTASESIQIPNLAGNHFIYYNPAGVLSTTQVASSDLFKENAFLAIVYWNTDTSTHSYFAEERHGLQMDGETHSYLHTVFGAQYLSGLALQNFVVNGNGSLATHAQFTADEGSIRDEDLLLTLAAQTEIPVLFRQGSLWRKKTADSFPVIYSGTAGYTGASGRLPYNQLVSGSWQLTQIANNDFVLVHIFATNDKETPIVAIQGTATYLNVTAARLAASTEITSLSGLPFAEFVALGSVVFESSNSYTNTPKARTRSINGGDYVDFRGTQLYTAAGVATSHNLLSGLAGDDHIQYHTDARGDIRYYTKAEVDALIGGGGSPGDISEDSYSFSNSQVIPENITGLIFAAASVRSFNALVSVSIDATSDLFETFELTGVNKSGSFSMSVSSVGDDSGVVFSITSTGQVQYTSSNYSGFVSGTIKFRAITTTV